MKIGIFGCGNVGAASAYACALRGIGTELVLVDKNHALAQAQAEDILHATPFANPVDVRAGGYDDLADAAIIMIAAGVNQKPGETRLDLLKRNGDVFADIIPRIRKAAPGAILLNATNPVDIMTHFAAKFSGGGAGRVIGSGTILDTARFRSLLAQHLRVSSHSIHAHVLGEHGDSEVLHWSGAYVGNISLACFAQQTGSPVTDEVRACIDEGVRRAAYKIIGGKGATWYGIGMGMARIAQAILDDESAVLTCCAPVDSVEGVNDVTLSLPRIVSSTGIGPALYPALEPDERAKLKHSAEVIRDALGQLGI
ncbi:MAG: L-lactate dehydrogenase [Alphaproteobacteria bacterium]|nr:L-lactate dehydrogenase [Alphaproteobacteria bacterium]